MDKGPDQGDFETTTPDDGPTQWPTEPDAAPSSEPGDASTASTGVSGGPDQLPTTAGAEVAVVSVAAVGALVIVGAGVALAWKRRRRTHW
jgi:hypothetical protein